MKKLWLLATLIALAFAGQKVQMETNHGNIVVELAPKQAPQTVKNFLRYVADGSYDGSLFHRVIQNFVVQGGGYNQQFQPLPTFDPVVNESRAACPTSVAASPWPAPRRSTAPPASSTSTWWTTTTSTPMPAPVIRCWRVVQGMEVLDKLAQVQTGYSSILRANDVPTSPIILKKVVLLADK